MPKFLAITSRGLIEPLASELREMNFKHVRLRPDAVEVETSWAELGRLQQSTRLATRILLPVSDFTAYNEEDLYFGVLRKHDFTQYINVNQTFRIEAKVRDHVKLRDQRFVAMKVKDAIADQFRKKFDRRPDVGSDENTDLRVVVRVVRTQVSLALDLTGESLSHRGYRLAAGEAPIRENVAAGLVRLSGWTPEKPLVDPFCGAGTILIEAARLAAGLPPSVRKREYAYTRLKTFKGPFVPAQIEEQAAPVVPRFFGFDVDPAVLASARENARRAGVHKWITFAKRDAREIEAPCPEPGILITNPPYGERLEDVERAKKLFSDFSTPLKSSFSGWDAWILSGNREAIQGLRLKAERRIPIWNGPIECRFLRYPLRRSDVG